MKDKFTKIEQILKSRFFIAPTALIYGGSSGFYDYGHLGSVLKNQIISCWKKFFTSEMNFYEIESSIILQENVLKASGHVDKFSDTLIFDKITGECYRADHYLADFVPIEIQNKLDCMSLKEIDELISKYDIKSPNQNPLGNATHFNLMFKTFVGPKTQNIGYLRPETAQGQFLNFKKIYDLNSSKLPFASFSVGKVFRNEISPRNGLLRVREFEQAEIEYFLDPLEKKHPKYEEIKDLVFDFHFGPEVQRTVKMKISEAIDSKIINNECLGYFIGRTGQFLKFLRIKDFRFRQHKKDEMAHYANDCWDCEIKINNEYVECVGIADRSCYDLKQHTNFSGTNLFAQKKLKEPKSKIEYKPIIDKKNWGKKYKKNLNDLIEKIENLKIDDVKLQNKIEFMGDDIDIEYERIESRIFEEDFIPAVIEPSFGIGRIFQAVIEHNFYERNEENRTYFSFIPEIAPYQVYISSLIKNEYIKEQEKLYKLLTENGIRTFIITQNVSMGRRYAHADQIGVPYFIVFDTMSGKEKSCTIRERNLMRQIRVKIENVLENIKSLIKGKNLEDLGDVIYQVDGID